MNRLPYVGVNPYGYRSTSWCLWVISSICIEFWIVKSWIPAMWWIRRFSRNLAEAFQKPKGKLLFKAWNKLKRLLDTTTGAINFRSKTPVVVATHLLISSYCFGITWNNTVNHLILPMNTNMFCWYTLSHIVTTPKCQHSVWKSFGIPCVVIHILKRNVGKYVPILMEKSKVQFLLSFPFIILISLSPNHDQFLVRNLTSNYRDIP